MRTIVKLTCLMALCIISTSIAGQSKVTYGIGGGVNYSNFFLGKYEWEYVNPHRPAFGFSFHGSVHISFLEKFGILADPGVIVTSVIDDLDLYKRSFFVSVPVKIEYELSSRIKLNSGIVYQRLLRFQFTRGSISRNFTWFANYRNYFNPTVGISFNVSDHLHVYLEGVYAARGTFNSGAYDLKGNIIFNPFKAKNHYVAFKIFYRA